MPKYWEQTWFKEKVIYKPKEIHENNFHTYPLETTNNYNWGKYLFKKVWEKIKRDKADIYIIIPEEVYLYFIHFSL